MSNRERAGERDREVGYRNSYVGRGGANFRGRGGISGYKPRRYWDNDEYYKDDRVSFKCLPFPIILLSWMRM